MENLHLYNWHSYLLDCLSLKSMFSRWIQMSIWESIKLIWLILQLWVLSLFIWCPWQTGYLIKRFCKPLKVLMLLVLQHSSVAYNWVYIPLWLWYMHIVPARLLSFVYQASRQTLCSAGNPAELISCSKVLQQRKKKTWDLDFFVGMSLGIWIF